MFRKESVAQSRNRTRILIAGAGPTGLVMALWLKKKGVPFRIIDKASGPGQFSRAIGVQARTLEFYHQLGIDKKTIDGGIIAEHASLWRHGQPIATIRLGEIGKGISPYPFVLFYPQDIHERMLIKELNELGVFIEWESELVGFQQDLEGVQAVLRQHRGEETVAVDYLCGCDGARSLTRHAMGSDFGGGTYSQVFFVADVEATGKIAAQGVQLSVSTKDFCIVLPLPHQGSVRLIGIVPPEKEGKEELSFEDVRVAVTDSTGLEIKKVNWFSSYRVHHRLARSFRQGRVFLAGDAGHIHSPVGAQGMNTGIGDAVGLAWKLAAVVQGQASAKILDTYEPERMGFAKVLVRTTDRIFQLVVNRSWLGRIWRAYAMPLALGGLSRSRRLMKIFFERLSQVRIRYPQSALSVGQAGDLRGGDRLPWVNGVNTDNFASLSSLQWQVHVYGEASDKFVGKVRSLGLACHQFAWSDETMAKGFQRNAAYLVRPDGYIGLALPRQSATALIRYLDRFSIRVQ